MTKAEKVKFVINTLQKLYPSIKEEGFPFCTVDGKPVGNLIYYWESGL